MIPQLQRVPRRAERPAAPHQQLPRRANDRQQADPLEQHAGQAAREILHARGLENSAANWKALKEAYLRGYEDGQPR